MVENYYFTFVNKNMLGHDARISWVQISARHQIAQITLRPAYGTCRPRAKENQTEIASSKCLLLLRRKVH